MKYTQCLLELETSEGITTQVSFIPSEYAKVGNIIQLKENDIWTNGWLVKAAYKETESPPDTHKAVRAHRKATGDSMPVIKRHD